MLKRLRLSDHGDTIVEVMVVLAVLGLAISISYATANRSLLNARQAQENAQATELAQSQIEALRNLTAVGTTPTIFQPGPYCVIAGTVVPGSCKTGSIPYTIMDTWTTGALTGSTFKITVTWPDIEGQGSDTVTSVYRLYQSP